ncbi:Glucanosyltransferase, partial [Xylogone sp. PMI_703]
MRNFFTRAVVTASTLVSFANALPTISVKGSKLFANGQQFFIKGFAYQGTPDDPLVDANQCKIDAAAMKTFGTNSIRVYHVDPTANHDDCMSIFEDAGIYIWLDLDTFTTQIEQTGPQWTKEQFYAFATVMDIFSSYSNLAGFWIGNEVITSNTGSPAAPYIKAAVTDIKAYMAAKKYRTFPIGYSAADIAELRPALQNYLVCGGEETAIDFYGINSYEWCGDSSYETSGYANLEAQAANYSVPIFFSETGCIVARPRLFTDQAAIFGPNMVDTFSGSIIYEWVEEVNDYGVVSYPGGGAKGTPTPIQPDYDNLMKQWKAINPAGVKEADYKPQFSAPPCPASAAGGWQVNGNVPIPTLGADVVK